MEKIIRLTESDLKRVIKEILNEDLGTQFLKSAAGPNTARATIPNGSLSFNGKTVNLYSDVENKKFYAQAKIYGEVTRTRLNGNAIIFYLNNKRARMSLVCTNPKKNEFTYLDNYDNKKLFYNTPLSTQLRKVWCTVNTSGASVPKADFASNTQKPTSDFA